MRRVKIYVILLLTVLFMPIFGISVRAANVTDTYFYFYLSGNNWRYTEGRAKENTTSVYVHLQEAPIYFVYARAEGYRTASGSTTGTYYWYNDTIGGDVVLPKGQQSSIRTLIYERGGRIARLGIKQFTEDGVAYGVWSPDSTRQYVVVN
ncbi:MAG: hypothetical protein C0P72_008300 [Clostridia bacterium]